MRIIVVDDEVKIVAALKEGLETQSHVVDTAFDGEQALELILKTEYDVVILDVMLPKYTGMQVCKKIRSSGIHTPIIMLSARVDLRDKVEGLDSGADDYVAKPFSFQELYARVRALSRRRYLDNRLKLEVDDVVMDLNRMHVSVSGRGVLLTPIEYRLLEFLMRNHGKVLDRSSIVENVWGSTQRNIMTNIVDVYIRKLRSKIERGTGRNRDLIRTVRGAGYIIDPQ